MKNCDLGLEKTARGLWPRAAFSRPRSQFFAIQTSQPANNIYYVSVCALLAQKFCYAGILLAHHPKEYLRRSIVTHSVGGGVVHKNLVLSTELVM